MDIITLHKILGTPIPKSKVISEPSLKELWEVEKPQSGLSAMWLNNDKQSLKFPDGLTIGVIRINY